MQQLKTVNSLYVPPHQLTTINNKTFEGELKRISVSCESWLRIYIAMLWKEGHACGPLIKLYTSKILGKIFKSYN